MPIPLGILAVAGAGAAAPAAYELIQTQILGSNTSTVTFSNLNTYTQYKHLQFRAVVRSSGMTTGDRAFIQMNGLAGTNYSEHRLFGDGSSTVTTGAGSQDKIQHLQIPGNAGTSGSFGVMIVDLLDFLSTSKHKTIRTLMGSHFATREIGLVSGTLNSTSALTSLSFGTVNGGYLAASRFSLYGIRG